MNKWGPEVLESTELERTSLPGTDEKVVLGTSESLLLEKGRPLYPRSWEGRRNTRYPLVPVEVLGKASRVEAPPRNTHKGNPKITRRSDHTVFAPYRSHIPRRAVT